VAVGVTSVALCALAAAAVLAPVPGSSRRLALVVAAPTPTRLGRSRRRPPVRRAAVAVACLAAGAMVATGLGVVPAVATGLLGSAAVVAADRYQRRRRAAAEHDGVIEAVGTLAAELRAGQTPQHALANAAQVASGAPAGVLATAAATGRYGGSVPAALRAGGGCCAEAVVTLRRVAAGWQVSEAAGAPLAHVLDRVERAARAGRQQRRELAALLAGPRATAGLLAVLPAVGLALSAAMGARPVAVLLHTAAGQAALLAGVLLDLAGVAWTARIVHAAEASA
jgi:tight adherence protein B